MKLVVLSSRPLNGAQAFLQKAMEDIGDMKLRSMALVAILDEPSEDACAVTGYYAMDLYDKERAAAILQRDIVRDMVDIAAMGPDEENEEEDTDG